MNTTRVGVSETARNRGIEFGQTTGLFFLVAVKRPEPGADDLNVGLVGTGIQTPLNGILKIGA